MKDNNLHNIKNSGFKTPKDYFEGLEDALLNEVKLKENVSKPGFTMPKDYLDSFEVDLPKENSKRKETKVIHLFNRRNLIMVSSIAAAIVLFFSLNIGKEDYTYDSLDIETVENYLLEESYSSELASLLEDEELIETNFLESETENIEYYLQDIDVEDIYQE